MGAGAALASCPFPPPAPSAGAPSTRPLPAPHRTAPRTAPRPHSPFGSSQCLRRSQRGEAKDPARAGCAPSFRGAAVFSLSPRGSRHLVAPRDGHRRYSGRHRRPEPGPRVKKKATPGPAGPRLPALQHGLRRGRRAVPQPPRRMPQPQRKAPQPPRAPQWPPPSSPQHRATCHPYPDPRGGSSWHVEPGPMRNPLRYQPEVPKLVGVIPTRAAPSHDRLTLRPPHHCSRTALGYLGLFGWPANSAPSPHTSNWIWRERNPLRFLVPRFHPPNPARSGKILAK